MFYDSIKAFCLVIGLGVVGSGKLGVDSEYSI